MKQSKIQKCKKYIYATGILVLLLFGITLQANAAPQLELGSATVSQGGTGTLNLNISGGTESYAGVNAKIILPQGINVEGISKGDLLEGFTADYYQLSNSNEVTVIAYSGNKTFSSDGVLLTLNLKVSENSTPNTYDVNFASADSSSFVRSWYALSDADGTFDDPSTKPGSITISEDSDNDGLKDLWEREYFGNLDQEGSGDYDNDGITNAQEYANGTDPTEGSSNFPDNWVTINGTVLHEETALCAMVLANGQYMFSCGEDKGRYEMKVPLDENGEITLYCFCDSLAPFKQIVTPDEAINFDIDMKSPVKENRNMILTVQFEPGTTNPDWINISGEVLDEDGTPLCAMLLANGEHTFSCGENQGIYELEVPLNDNGEITLHGFCDGVQPYKQILNPENPIFLMVKVELK